MNTLRLSTLSLILAIAVITLGYASYSSAAPPCSKNPRPDCVPDDGGDTTSGGKHRSLILTFADLGGDNIQSDTMGAYVDKEGAAVSAGGQTQPNAAGIAFTPKHKAKNARFVDLIINCVLIDDSGPCADLPSRLQDYFHGWPYLTGPFARCVARNNCAGIHLKLRPYEVNCPDPDPDDGTCPSIYTMSTGSTEEFTEQMSYRVGFGSGLLIEIASDIGGADSPNPGRCLSLMEGSPGGARETFKAACKTSGKCNVTVEAFNLGAGDGENDSWTVTATDATALICDRQSGTVLGKATMSFEFTAEKKD